jgi:hypothetical protein
MARELGVVASMDQGGGQAPSPDGWTKLEPAVRPAITSISCAPCVGRHDVACLVDADMTSRAENEMPYASQ